MRLQIDTKGLSRQEIYNLTKDFVNTSPDDKESVQVWHDLKTDELTVLGTAGQLREVKKVYEPQN